MENFATTVTVQIASTTWPMRRTGRRPSRHAWIGTLKPSDPRLARVGVTMSDDTTRAATVRGLGASRTTVNAMRYCC